MKICITYSDGETAAVDLLLAAIKSVNTLRYVMKETPERDGYRHIYMKTPRTKPCKNA